MSRRPSSRRSCARGALAVAVGVALVACGRPQASSADTEPDDDSTTGESGEDPSTTFGPFVPESDVRAGSCDVWQQDCPEGDKCVPYANSDEGLLHECVPVTGSQAPGEPCSYAGADELTDDCDASGACWNVVDVDGELIGECLAFCAGTAGEPICPPGSYCLLASDGSPGLCQPSCDPVGQDCHEPTVCTWQGDVFTCMFTNDIPAGQPCQFIQDCAAGSVCLAAEAVPDCGGSACCAAYCELGLGDGPCEVVPGSVCMAFFSDGEAPPEYADLGVCVLPGA